jgi:hypothetical protein
MVLSSPFWPGVRDWLLGRTADAYQGGGEQPGADHSAGATETSVSVGSGPTPS